MPREVHLEPNGSPFVHSTPFDQQPIYDISMADSSLAELSVQFPDNDNLNSSNALAGLADITVGMGDETSIMKLPTNESDEMLMGVKGEEFLADDSTMGFDTPFLSKSTSIRTRSKLKQSTTITPSAPEDAIVEMEEPVQAEKPRRKKSTRSRSSSPSKKSLVSEPAPAPEKASVFPQGPMETMAEEPEPELEPEPEPKLRRSPRKARTRAPSAAEPSAAPPITASSRSPFATSTTQPTFEPTPAPELVTQLETKGLTESQSAPATKTKRASRVVGRSKSKTRSKSTRVEGPLEGTHEAQSPALPEGGANFDALPAASPLDTANAASTLVPALDTASAVVQVDIEMRPVSPPARPSLATSQTVESGFYPVHTEPGPAPFKFQLPPSMSRSRTQSSTFNLSDTLTSSSPPTSNNSTALVLTGNSIPEEQGESKDPTAEEEAEAIAAAMRILRRDSLVFAPRQSHANEQRQSDAPKGIYPSSAPEKLEEPALVRPTINEPTPTELAEAIPKRTRVGRRSTRARGGAGAAVIGRTERKDGNAAQDTREQEQQSAEETSISVVSTGKRLSNSNASDSLNDSTHTLSELSQGAIGEEQQDIAVRVNFGSCPPSPAEHVEPSSPAMLGQTEEVHRSSAPENLPEPGTTSTESKISPAPELKDLPPKESKISPLPSNGRDIPVRSRTTRASMPTQISQTSLTARTTRGNRRSEVRPPLTRGGSNIKIGAPNEALIEEKDTPREVEKLPTDSGDHDRTDAISTPTRTDAPETIISTIPLDSLATPAPALSPEGISADSSADGADEPIPAPQVAKEPTPESNPRANTQQKASGLSGEKASQRAVSGASQRVASTASQRTTSGSSQPRRAVSSTLQRPATTAHKGTSTTHKPIPVSSLDNPSSALSSVTRLSGPQQTTISSQKPIPPTNNESSVTSATRESAGPTRIAVNNKAESNPFPSGGDAGGSQSGNNTPESGPRTVRALPKRATGFSQNAAVTTVPEDSMETSSMDIHPEETRNVDPAVEQATQDSLQSKTNSTSIWPREPAPNPFAPVNNSTEFKNRTSPMATKRPAPPLIPELEADANDSPNKRVRFSAVLEAGPTPSAGKALQMPKPSLKIKKPRFERKANRPKRVLTRDWVVGDVPSYAAPLKRNVQEREMPKVVPAEKARSPLSESQINARAVANKPKPTVPVAFTFRSELRLKPQTEQPLPAAIPIANPMPDFAAAHAAAEAASLMRRQRAQQAFLEAQAELDAYRDSKHVIGGETARRAAERAVFDAAMKVKEAEAERVRVEQRRLEAEMEAMEIKEMRKKMVPKANPVPEFYKYVARNDAKDTMA